MSLWSINSGKEGWGNGWGDEFSWILEWLKSISHGRFFSLCPTTHFLFCLWKRESLSFRLDTCMTIGGLHFPASPEAVGGNDVPKSWPMNVWEDGSPPWSRMSSFPSSRLEDSYDCEHGFDGCDNYVDENNSPEDGGATNWKTCGYLNGIMEHSCSASPACILGYLCT